MSTIKDANKKGGTAKEGDKKSVTTKEVDKKAGVAILPIDPNAPPPLDSEGNPICVQPDPKPTFAELWFDDPVDVSRPFYDPQQDTFNYQSLFMDTTVLEENVVFCKQCPLISF